MPMREYSTITGDIPGFSVTVPMRLDYRDLHILRLREKLGWLEVGP